MPTEFMPTEKLKLSKFDSLERVKQIADKFEETTKKFRGLWTSVRTPSVQYPEHGVRFGQLKLTGYG